MIAPSTHAARRRRLRALVDGPILLVGLDARPRNQRLVSFPFRQDSTFLYFTGCREPGAALLLDGDEETLFLPDRDPREVIWDGIDLDLGARAARLGFARVRPARELPEAVAALPAPPAALAVPDDARNAAISALVGQPLRWVEAMGPDALVDAVIRLRRTLGPEEVAEQRAAAAILARAHHAAMAASRPGVPERHVRALFEATLAAAEAVPSFPTIATVHGEVLHNERADGVLEDGRLFLLDGGAEVPSGYATDVTRTWPVSGRFTPRQRAAYEAVLAAQAAGIAAVRPGVRYREVHLAAARVVARFMADEGMLRCDPDTAVEAGAHALIFPHGVGHLVGLDVHDLEDFGDRATYGPGRSRSEQFGLAFLRIDLDLEPGMVVTVEPGIYFIPALLADREVVEPLRAHVHLDRIADWVGLGGIRIEDDVLVTDDGHEVLTGAIVKSPAEIEARVGTAGLAIPT